MIIFITIILINNLITLMLLL